jgi:Zn-dependent protease
MSDSHPDTPPRPRVGGLLGAPRTLFRLRGVPVRADASLLVMGAFIVFLVWGRFTALLGDLGTVTVVLASVAVAVLFFASILVHELGHAFASLDRGIPVASITLFALGGVTESTREARRARDEFVIVGIGPFLSLVLAAAFGLLYAALETVRVPAAVAGYLAWANLLLALFNVIPGYPLDGGRLLRSILWQVTGRPHRATMWAARVGQAFAALLIVTAVGPYLGVDLGIPYLRSGSLWNAFIGLFLFRGATDAYRAAALRERLANRTVGQLMGSVPETLPADLPISAAIGRIERRPSLLWPVGTPLRGAVTLAQLDRVPSARWDTTSLAEVAIPRDEVAVGADEPLEAALERLANAPGAMLLVVDGGGAPVGLLTPSLVSDPAG